MKWATTTKNYALIGRLTVSGDAHAANFYYHHDCYTRLRNSANAKERKTIINPPPPPFDPIICAQIVAIIENATTTVFKLSELREMYQKLTNDQGTPCQNKREPHATCFKEHLLKLLPDWDVFCRETKGTKTVYFSHQQKMVDELAKTHQSQVNQVEALILMRAAMMIHKLCLKSQEHFGGSFSSDCLTGSVNKEMKSFF